MSGWYDKNGFKLSNSKSTAVIFTRKTSGKENVNLSINGSLITIASEVKFLGVILDDKLTWRQHVDYVETKCKARLNLMRCVIGRKWGASKRALMSIYRMLIRSLIDYASIAYDTANKTIKKRLGTIQSKAMRITCLQCSPQHFKSFNAE